MAGGYTGPLIALDVDNDDLFDLANPLKKVNEIQQGRANIDQTRAQTADQLLRTQQLETEQPAIAAEASLRQARAKAGVLQSADSLIARAAAQIDPTDPQAAAKWDAAMQGAVEAGAKDAGQFLGKYTPALHQRVVQTYAAPNPLEAAAASAGGGMPGQNYSPQQAQQWDTMFQGKKPEELTAAVEKLDTYRQALQRVMQSPNPSAQWNTEAQTLGHGAAVGNFNPLRLQQMWGEIAPMEAYLQSRIASAGAGLPGPVPPTEVKEAGGALYGVTPGPQGPQVKPLTPQGTWQLQGTNQQGQGVYRNSVTGEEKAGATQLGAKPGTTNAGHSVFEKKQKAWLDTHPGDDQGALDFAGGKKAMTPQQATVAANAQAARDLQALTLGGQPPPDPAEYLTTTAAAHYAEIMSAGGASAGGGAAPPPAPYADPGPAKAAPMPNPGPAPPARAIAKLKEGVVTPFANGQSWVLRHGKPVRVQ